MLGSRTAIRNVVKARVDDAVNYPVFASRDIDGREEQEFANVYFADGDVTYEGLQRNSESNLVIVYRNSGEINDDFIDLRGDEIQAAIESEPFGDEMRGILYTGFEYLDDQERSFSGIELRFTVYY